jgi:Nitroreductase family
VLTARLLPAPPHQAHCPFRAYLVCPRFSNGRAGLISATRPALAGSLVGFGLEMIGIGAAIENIWLAAEALGVRVAFMGDVVIAEDDIRATLGIAGDLVGVLALGFSDRSGGAPTMEPFWALAGWAPPCHQGR